MKKRFERMAQGTLFFGILALVLAGLMGCPNPAAPKPDPVLAGSVVIKAAIADGPATEGETLTADTTELGGTGTIHYQWLRLDDADDLSTAEEIDGADGAAYVLTAADIGKYISVRLSRDGYAGVVIAKAAGPVEAAQIPELTGTVTITGIPSEGETLTANTLNLDGTGAIHYQWLRLDDADDPSAAEEIDGADNETYDLTAADLDTYISVRVSRDDYSGAVTAEPVGPAAPEGYVGVTNILLATTGFLFESGNAVDLKPLATVMPVTATKKDIRWVLTEDDGTGVTAADLEDGEFTPAGPGTLKLTAVITGGKTPGRDYRKSFTLTFTTHHIGVTGITLPLANTLVKGSPIDLTAATAAPPDAARQEIIWSVKDAGTTGVTTADLTGGVFTPATAGTLKLKALITDGLALGSDYVEEFTLVIRDAYVAVTNISLSLLAYYEGGAQIDLTAAEAEPSNATYQTITWSVKDAGTTGVNNANLVTGKFTPAANGTLVLTATVKNGKNNGTTDYTKDFTLEIGCEAIYSGVSRNSDYSYDPVVGQPQNTALPTGWSFTSTVVDISWSPVHPVFQAGVVYQLKIVYKASPGYWFDGRPLSVTVGNYYGPPAYLVVSSVDREGDTATAVLTYPELGVDSSLEDTLLAARIAKQGVRTSAAAAGVPSNISWVTPAQMAAFDAVRLEALMLFETHAATQAQATAMAGRLATATGAFNGQKAYGTGTAEVVSELFTSLAGMKAWLTGLPANTVTSPYHVRLSIDLSALTYKNATSTRTNTYFPAGKYAALDLTACTGDLGNEAFANCATLVSVEFPAGLAAIGKFAFSDCVNLTGQADLSGLTDLGRSAFYNTNITGVIMPAGINIVWFNMTIFYDCSNLAKVTFLQTTPVLLQMYIFDGTPSTMKMYVPAGSVEAYKTTSVSGWAAHAGQIEALPW
jgi:hypothetical protein